MEADRKKLIDKIVKLLALANSSDFSEEAKTAKNLAAELLAKHDIAVFELEDGAPYTCERGIGVKFNADHSWRSTGSKGYDVHLYNSLARLNGVAMFVGRYEMHDFVGRPADLEAFKYMRELVVAQRDAALASYCRETGKRDRSAWRMGFALGVSDVVSQLMAASVSKQKEWGLVPVRPYEQAKDWYIERHKVGHGGGWGGAHNAAGYAAGKSVSLNKGVSAQSGQRLIGR